MPCFQTIFNTEFEAGSTGREDAFIKAIKREEADAAVVCFCSAREEDAEKLLKLESLAGPMPLLTCSRAVDLSFVSFAVRQGVDRFLKCGMEKHEIQSIISEAIRQGGLKGFLLASYPESMAVSAHIRKMIDEIVHAFPHRLQQAEMSARLGISRSWLHKLCGQAFGQPLNRIMRRIWVHQALRMMRHIGLDNTEIALHLNYSEESSMARDFRKELDCSPGEARERLANHSPVEIMLE